MTQYEKMIDLVHRSDVLYIETSSEACPAVSICHQGECAIFFNEKAFATDAEKHVALAHEKGHCDTGAFYRVNSSYDTKSRCEYRASKSAVFDILPISTLLPALEKCIVAGSDVLTELSEQFSVTPHFVEFALALYRQKEMLPAHVW